MTTAVCFRCGELKFGAFCPCDKCGETPASDDELVLSLAMTDHYFDKATLEEMGQKVREGDPPHLDPESREQLLQVLRQVRAAPGVTGLLAGVIGGSATPEPSGKRWWQFWRRE
jgi:hypothetical protein